MEDQNENLKSLINLQSIIKNLLIKELDDVKSKIHNITLDNYSEKNLMAYDEDGTPIYHDENHSFDFDDELTF